MFNWSKRISCTADELATNQFTYNGRQHQDAFQRAGYRALQKFRAAGPELAGQPRELFFAVEAVVKGLQNANFHRESVAASGAPARLEAAIQALIEAKPVPFDLDTLAAGNSYTRGLVLVHERDKSLCLTQIPNFEVRMTQGNPWSQEISNFGMWGAGPNADPLKLIGAINRLHIAAVEMFLEHFAQDIPEPVDEIEAARAVADNACIKAAGRQAQV